MARRSVRKPSTEAVNAGFDRLDLPRMSTADLVKPPSAVKRRHVSKASQQALAKHAGVGEARVKHTNRKAPGAKRQQPRTDFSRMPTQEQQAANEYLRLPGEAIDARNKGEMLLVNLSSRARGAGVMFNRGQISRRELGAAMRICELAERAQLSQLSAPVLGERVDGGKVDLDGSRLRGAAAAYGEYREALETLSRVGRILVENVVVFGKPMEEAVRMRTVALRLGGAKNLKWRAQQATILLRDALDRLGDVFHLPGD